MIQNKEAMETKFNFNSAICTSRSQSERLLSLGLKKETADMVLCEPFDYEKRKYSDEYVKIVLEEGEDFCKEDIPAWSLHRLIEMIDDEFVIHLNNFTISGHVFGVYNNLYDNIVECITYLISAGYFNKEYLV